MFFFLAFVREKLRTEKIDHLVLAGVGPVHQLAHSKLDDLLWFVLSKNLVEQSGEVWGLNFPSSPFDAAQPAYLFGEYGHCQFPSFVIDL